LIRSCIHRTYALAPLTPQLWGEQDLISTTCLVEIKMFYFFILILGEWQKRNNKKAPSKYAARSSCFNVLSVAMPVLISICRDSHSINFAKTEHLPQGIVLSLGRCVKASEPIVPAWHSTELECKLKTLYPDPVLKYTAIDRHVSLPQFCS